MQDILLGKVKYEFDEQKLEDELEKELAEMSYNPDEDTLNQSHVSIRDFAQIRMEQLKQEKEEMEKQLKDNEILKEYKASCLDREKMFEEIEGDIKKLKQLTGYVNNDEEIEISDDDCNEKIKFKSQAITSEQLKQIKQQVQKQFEEQAQIVYAEDILEQKLLQKEKQAMLQISEFGDTDQELNESQISMHSSQSKRNQINKVAESSLKKDNQDINKPESKKNIKASDDKEKPEKVIEDNKQQQIINDGKSTQVQEQQKLQPSTSQSSKNNQHNNFIGSEVKDKQSKARGNEGTGIVDHSSVMQQSQVNKLKQSNLINPATEQLELRKQKMAQEREQMNMEKEDLRSLEYEEYFHKQQFKNKDCKLPSKFYHQTEKTYSECHTKFVHPPTNLIQPLEILAPTSDNLASKNSKEVCFENLKFIKFRSPQTESGNQQLFKFEKNNGKKEILKPVHLINVLDSLSLTDKESEVKKDNRNDTKKSKEDESNMVNNYNSIMQIYYYKVSSQLSHKLQQIQKQGILSKIKQLTEAYKPRLLNIFQDDENAIHALVDQEDLELEEQQGNQQTHLKFKQGGSSGIGNSKTKSLSSFLSEEKTFMTGDLKKTNKLELKLENISDLKDIQKVPNLQILHLSVNKIAAINEIISCKKLIEVNLGQNLIVDYSPLSQLEELRLLNLELNLITRIQPLQGCRHLQILNLNNNQIQKIENLEFNQQLRRLLLFKNKVRQLSGLEQLLLLEELDLGHNQVQDLEGLEHNCLLRKLVLYHNSIVVIPQNFSLLLLMELYLNNNSIVDISGLRFLPSLQYLNLQENQIEIGIGETQVLALPNLQKLLIGYNLIPNFAAVYNMLKFSPNIKVLSYLQNDFLKNISVNLQEVYEYLFISKLRSLEEINNVRIDIGHTKYLEMKFSNILQNVDNSVMGSGNSCSTRSYLIMQQQQVQEPNNRQSEFEGFLNRFSMISKEFLYANNLESRRMQLSKVSAFVKTLEYIIHKDQSGQFHLMNLFNSKFNWPCNYYKNVFHLKDFYDNKYGKCIHKIRSLFIRMAYKRRKRLRYFLQQEKKLIMIQAQVRRFLIQKHLKIKEHLAAVRFRNKAKFAIKIQKVFRGHLLRKRKKMLFNNIKYDVGDLPDFDDAWLKNEPDFELNLQIPEGFDLENIIMPPPQQQQIINQQHIQSQKKIISSRTNFQQQLQNGVIQEEDKADSDNAEVQSNLDEHGEGNQEAFYKSNLSLKSSNSAAKINNADNKKKNLNEVKKGRVTDDEKKKLMEEWGFEKPEVVQALAYKLEKDRKRQNMKKKHELTAMEKYQLFLKNSKNNKQ